MTSIITATGQQTLNLELKFETQLSLRNFFEALKIIFALFAMKNLGIK